MSTNALANLFGGKSWPYWYVVTGFIVIRLAYENKNPLFGSLACLIFAIISLIAWIKRIRHARLIATTPLSSIASAAQGYVKIQGTVSPKSEYTIVAPGGLPCVWYRCVITSSDRIKCDCITSDSIFELNDASGEPCLVDPEHADIETSQKRSWISDDTHYDLELLFPGDTVSVMGELSTLTANTRLQELHTDVSLLLAEWKKDQTTLLKRFDKNRNGRIDLDEWEAARQEAYQQISQQNREVELQPDIHIIRQSQKKDLPFVISDLTEPKRQLRSTLWTWLHLASFFGGLYLGVWFLVR